MRIRVLLLTIALFLTGGYSSFSLVSAQTPTPTVVDSPTVKVLTGLLGVRVDLPFDSDLVKLSPGPLEHSVLNADDVRAWAAELEADDRGFRV